MKYLVPPIVIPALVFIAVVAYSLLRPPLVGDHTASPVVKAQPR